MYRLRAILRTLRRLLHPLWLPQTVWMAARAVWYEERSVAGYLQTMANDPAPQPLVDALQAAVEEFGIEEYEPEDYRE